MARKQSRPKVNELSDSIVSRNGSPAKAITAPRAVLKSPKRKPPARSKTGRRRGRKPYPILSFEQTLRFGEGVAEVGAGHPVKRATLFTALKITTTQTTKDLITASCKYNITKGSHDAKEYSLTPEGKCAVEAIPSPERNRARIKLAITDIEPFRHLYEKFRGGKMPAIEAMCDTLEDLDEGDRAPCVDIFVQNAKFVGILQTLSWGRSSLTPDDAAARIGGPTKSPVSSESTAANMPVAGEDYDTVCFFIALIAPTTPNLGNTATRFFRHT